MELESVKELINNYTKDLVDLCPHCWWKTHIEKLWNDYHTYNNWDREFYVIFRCKPCKKLLLKTYYFEQNPYGWGKVMLKDKWWNDKYPMILDTELKSEDIKHIPENVYFDYKEALRCKWIYAYKAACSMFRRTLQSWLLHLGADKKLDLIAQINVIDNLPSDIKDWSHQIRIFWNWWTHPDQDNLKDVNEDDVIEVQDFISKFLTYMFIMPEKVKISRQRRDERTNKTED